jgi:lipopolysaccharide biosynthesis glycosyltransferase
MHPSQVQVLIDADIIVTQPLTEFIEAARAGRVVAFIEPKPTHNRSFREWASRLGLAQLRRQPYLNAGQLFVPESLGRRLYPLWTEGQKKVKLIETRYGKARLRDPFYFADQDVLNAVLAGHFEAGELMLEEHRLAPHYPFPGLHLVDANRLACRYPDGTEPFLLHHILAKPWLKATRTTIYSQLLSRLLLAPDVALRLEPRQLPLRLREGKWAAADRRRAHLQALVYSHSRRQLGRFGIRTRIADRRPRMTL